MNWVLTQPCSMSQIVHVVSMLDVPTMFLSVSFQSKEVSGAQYCDCYSGQLIRTVESVSAYVCQKRAVLHLAALVDRENAQVVA